MGKAPEDGLRRKQRSIPASSRRAVRLRTGLIVPFAALIVSSVAITGILSYYNGREAVLVAADHIRAEINTRIREQVLAFMDKPWRILEANADAIWEGRFCRRHVQEMGRGRRRPAYRPSPERARF